MVHAGGMDNDGVGSQSEPAASAPPTDVVQAIQRRTWSRGVFAVVAAMVLLVALGWAVGSISADARRAPVGSEDAASLQDLRGEPAA